MNLFTLHYTTIAFLSSLHTPLHLLAVNFLLLYKTESRVHCAQTWVPHPIKEAMKKDSWDRTLGKIRLYLHKALLAVLPS